MVPAWPSGGMSMTVATSAASVKTSVFFNTYPPYRLSFVQI
jgi:hypothetical protein